MNYWHVHIGVRDFCGLWFNGLNGTDPSSLYHVNTHTNVTRFRYCHFIVIFTTTYNKQLNAQLLRMGTHSPLPCTVTHTTGWLHGICLVMYATSPWGVRINLLPMVTTHPT